MLRIKDLYVSVAGRRILDGLTLAIDAGEVHAIMGPNGSGKSTLANVLAGRDGYVIESGSVEFEGEDLFALSAEERARAGVFLAFQYPVEIPGVSNLEFLKASLEAICKAQDRAMPATPAFLKRARTLATELGLDGDMLKRGVNEGFSGGEKKRNEILQLRLLEPKLALLDETDSGLDIDALKLVADGINLARDPGRAFLLVTHYQRLLDFVVPDKVHVLARGRIQRTGGPELAHELEARGYGWILDDAG
jgi:Fe-S cluster assembly ATP-binding protein